MNTHDSEEFNIKLHELLRTHEVSDVRITRNVIAVAEEDIVYTFTASLHLGEEQHMFGIGFGENPLQALTAALNEAHAREAINGGIQE